MVSGVRVGTASTGSKGFREAERVPIYAPWHEALGPTVALGRLTAMARRHDGGALTRWFDVHRPERASDVLADLRRRRGPAILLCSDYIWTRDDNLALAREASAIEPELLVLHGGPHAPAYPAEAEAFLREHGPAARVLVRGEGEDTLVAILEALVAGGDLDPRHLHAVLGLTYLDGDGALVRTADRPRRADLGGLPSPFLTGEFDDIPIRAWRAGVHLESNRGCPYGCTFCDWGSATLARVRSFPRDVVVGEVRWAAERGASCIGMADANFGMSRRDAELVDELVAIHREVHAPQSFVFCPAKNTTRHLIRILEALRDGGLVYDCSLGIQSVDEPTLEAVDRTNISTGRMVELARALRTRGLRVPAELVAGLPGQTVDSLAMDLGFVFDHELHTTVHSLRLLPNSPMNEPEHRRRHQIEVDQDGFVVSTATYTSTDRATMTRLAKLWLAVDHFGVLRHVARWLQWDRRIPFATLLRSLDDAVQQEPQRWPALGSLTTDLLEDQTPPRSWAAPSAEVRRFLLEVHGVGDGSALDAIIAAQVHVLPTRGRLLPATIELPHDVVAWSRAAGWGLLGFGADGHRFPPLESYGPGTLTIESDPLDLANSSIRSKPYASVVRHDEVARYLHRTYELLSPLTSPAGFDRMVQLRPDRRAELESYRARWAPVRDAHGEPDPPGTSAPVGVELGRRA